MHPATPNEMDCQNSFGLKWHEPGARLAAKRWYGDGISGLTWLQGPGLENSSHKPDGMRSGSFQWYLATSEWAVIVS